MWVKMIRERSFTPPEERRVSVHYLKGETYRVKRAWGDEMVAQGYAEEIETPGRDEGDADDDE